MISAPMQSPFGPFFALTSLFPKGTFAYFLLKGNQGVSPESIEAFLAWRGHGTIKVHKVDQVHSNKVVSANEAPCEADAIVVTRPGEAARVVTADCVPLLIASQDGRAAAVHAGWRGTLAKIASRAIAEIGSPPSRLAAYVGPSIGPCCYAVDAERHRSFREVFGEAVKPRAGQEPYRLDLSALNAALLTEAGVAPEKIFREERCTSCAVELCCSYRRDGERAGRMAAVIGLERRG